MPVILALSRLRQEDHKVKTSPCYKRDPVSLEKKKKKRKKARCWCLKPVLLATQEDHSSKPAQANSSRDPISSKQNKTSKKGLMKLLKV
jgi:hypothetical protein